MFELDGFQDQACTLVVDRIGGSMPSMVRGRGGA